MIASVLCRRRRRRPRLISVPSSTVTGARGLVFCCGRRRRRRLWIALALGGWYVSTTARVTSLRIRLVLPRYTRDGPRRS
jgi:hypothetical protein